MLTNFANKTSQQPTRRRAIAGPTVWNHTSLDEWGYMVAVNPRQAAACLRVRDELRLRIAASAHVHTHQSSNRRIPSTKSDT